MGWAPNGNDKRPDGSLKGSGWLGSQKRPDGKESSELTVGVNLGGEETDLPLMVPSLTKDEVNHLLSGKRATRQIMDKAVNHALARKAAGKSPYASEEESKAAQAANDDDAEEKAMEEAFGSRGK